MPLAYTQLVQIMADLLIAATPFALLHSVGGVGAVVGTALVTFFHSSILYLAKMFLDPLNNDQYSSDMGINVAMVQTAGSTVTGMSKVAISGASTNTASTLPLRIIGFVNGPFSAVGDAKTDCLVIINTHQYRSVGITGI